ncbi:MAG TPA: hypothetical protein VG798_05795 [Rhizomicrobium sp.]|nr:hypothetical protein [Rhizomicrobium sp.]HWC63463.1 hypothetical protein [Rhizomicrobium sp.]
MNSVVDPENVSLPEMAAAIKFWTRQALGLNDEFIVSVSEFACGKPTCPNQHTAIMVMSQEGPQRKISIHKRIADICEFDVLDACLDSLRNSPA